MRLLDPFAGLYLASGIPAMHASLFIASFYTLYFTAVDVDDSIAYAFHFLRWGHLLTWILLMIVSYTQSTVDSDVEHQADSII